MPDKKISDDAVAACMRDMRATVRSSDAEKTAERLKVLDWTVELLAGEFENAHPNIFDRERFKKRSGYKEV